MQGAAGPVSADEWNARSEKWNANRRTALVLSGGIAKGVYEAGVVKSLLAQGYAFDVICGTSIGALNGALIAQGDDVELNHIWATLADKPILKLVPQAQLLYDAYEKLTSGTFILTKVIEVLSDVERAWGHGSLLALMGAFDPTGAQDVLSVLQLDRIRTPLMCAATNVDTGRAEAFYASPSGNAPPVFDPLSQVPVNTLQPANPAHVQIYPEVVRASGALPGAFAPVALPGFGYPPTDPSTPYRYSDGGVANNTPVTLARKLGVTDMICVFLSTGTEVTSRAGNLIAELENLYAANQNQLLDDELILAIGARNSLGRNEGNISQIEATPANRVVNIYEVRPTTTIPVPELGFNDQVALDESFAQGVRDGSKPPIPYSPPRTYPLRPNAT
jgi:predicted acylesterase/phospholipase RssA